MAKEVLELEVKSDIGKTTKEADRLAKSIDKSTKHTKELRAASNIGTVGFNKLRSAVTMVGTALKALGVGLIIAAFATLKQVFEQNQKVLDFFNTAMTSLNIAFNDLFNFLNDNIGGFTGFFKDIFENPQQALKDFGDMIKENLIERFNSLLDTFGYVGSALKSLFQGKFGEAADFAKLAGKEILDVSTGVNDSFDKLGNTINKVSGTIVDYAKKTITTAGAITELTKAALLAEVQFAKLNAENLRNAEIQRQIRDDVSKTFAVRIAANEKLSEILKKQSADQKVQLQIQLDAAKAANLLNDTTETKIALGQAEVAMLELKETITGQISEQLTNQTGLEEELRQGREQSLAEGTSGLERELEELRLAYEEKKRLAIKSGVDTTAITKQYEKQKSDLVRENVNVQLEAFSGLAGALSALAGDNKALAVASAVIDTYVGANKAFAQGGVAGFATGAAVIAAGLNNVRTIMATDVPSSGGGGGTVAAPSTPAPQMMSGAFDISGGVAPEATKAYVVTDEMSNSQNQLANIRRRATI